MAEAYPLYWPEGWKRTKFRERSRFKTGFGAARNLLFAELNRLGANRIILSTNIPLRNDGLPRANIKPDGGDPGVAVYFKRNGRDMVFACDKFIESSDNIYAIAKTIDAMRGIERWGASDMMERAFTGFAALPEKTSQSWRDVLGLHVDPITIESVEHRFKELARTYHPDLGGDADQFRQIVQAREDARKELAA